MLQRFIEDDPVVHPDDTLMREEIYQMVQGNASFEGYDEWNTDGELISSVRFSPYLPLDPEDWIEEIEVVATIWMDNETWTEPQVWTGLQDYQSLWELDVHDRETNPLHTQWWNRQGEVWGWRTSEEAVLSSAYGTTIRGLSWEGQQFQQLIEPPENSMNMTFPLEPGMAWSELWMEWSP